METQIILESPQNLENFKTIIWFGQKSQPLGCLTLWNPNSFIGRTKSWLEQVFQPSAILSEPSSTPLLPSHIVPQIQLFSYKTREV